MTYQFRVKILKIYGLKLYSELLHPIISTIFGHSLTVPASSGALSFIKFTFAVGKTLSIPMDFLPFIILLFFTAVFSLSQAEDSCKESIQALDHI